MAYSNYNRYNREWDQGKNYGHENYDDASAGRVRPREEDYGEYPGGEKRRKYQNADWRGASYPNDGENAWPGSAQFPDHNASVEAWQDDRQARGPFPHSQGQTQNQFANPNRRRLVPSEPSPHVIFLGLDPDHTEADLHGHLLSLGCVLDNVTIIRDRATGLSKGFGFAQFSSTEHAKTFVTPRFPFISVPPPASHGASALQAYNLALETGAAQNGRRVKIDFSQSAHPPERGGTRGRFQANDGTRDIGNTQAPVVLLRGLDLSSSPEAIAQGLRASAGPHRDGAKGMKRIILVKDKYSGASWGYAFVELVDVQSSSALLADLMSPQLHPSGFRIAERPVAASFAHPYSFQPLAENMLRDESCVSSSLATGGVEGTWAKYWDEGATVAELSFDVETPAPMLDEKDSKPKKKKETTKVSVLEEAAPVEASSLPVSDKPVTLSFKGSAPAVKMNTTVFGSGPVKTVATSSLGFTTDNPDAPNTEDDGVTKVSSESEKATVFKKVAPLIASKKVANNISKWNNVQGELNNKAPSATLSAAPTLDSATVEAPRATGDVKSASGTPTPGALEDELMFSDPKGLACLLCSRQFKSTEQLRRHNKESDLHKKNFKDANLRQIAAQKASALKATIQPKYRDRASERRVLHNQPDIPLPEPGSSTQRKQADGPPPPAPPPPPPVHPGKDESNIGNKLLKKMGWAEGNGLGTDGDGRVDPIQTAIYAQGVGLGASKGKEIGKYADGYSGYVSAVRDSAKERYEGR